MIEFYINLQMDLKPIEGYEGLYSFDFNTNQVYAHKHKKYVKKDLDINGYCRIRLCKSSKTKNFMFHRLIYEMYNGTIQENMYIDHIDNDRQNNNLDNLRLCTLSQNAWNSKTPKNNTTGYKNIYKTKNNTYKVQICKNIKKVYQKTFKTLEEAILNRNINLVLIHGEFANLN